MQRSALIESKMPSDAKMGHYFIPLQKKTCCQYTMAHFLITWNFILYFLEKPFET